jgi:hypothetical protein
MAVQNDVPALRLCDLQQVCAHSSEANGLCGSRSFIGGGHLLQRILVHTEEDCCGDENASQGAHVPIVALLRASSKTVTQISAGGGNSLFSAIDNIARGRDRHDDMAVVGCFLLRRQP